MAKLNLSSIKEGLFQHVEKLGLGIAGCLFLYLLYGVFSLSGVSADKSPSELQNLATQKQGAVNSSPMPTTEIPPDTNFTQRAQPRKIDLPAYEVRNVWKPMFREPYQKRGQPKLLAVADLRSSVGTGSFVYSGTPPEADEPVADGGRGMPGPQRGRGRGRDSEREAPMRRVSPRGPVDVAVRGVTSVQAGDKFRVLNYVVVTGLIPYRGQFELYHTAFTKVQGQHVDEPVYDKTELQRAELPPGQSTISPDDADKLTWKAVEADDATYEKYFKDWVQGSPREVVNPKHLMDEGSNETPVFAALLGPLWHRDWGPEAAHPPEIRYLQPGTPPEADDEEEGTAGESTRTVAPPPMPGRQVFGRVDPRGEGRGPRGGNVPGAGRGAAVGVMTDLETIPKHKLFRFVDFTAEAGKTYVYRVRLVLENPNHQMDKKFLQSEDLRKEEFVFTPWSDPTQPVTMQDAAASLLVEGKRERKYTVNKVTRPVKAPWLRVLGFDPVSGLPLSTILPAAPPGAVLNTKTDVDAADPTTQAVTTYKNISFITNMAVVDIYGGRESTTKDHEKITEPVEVVLADSKGRIHYRHELDDAESNKEYADLDEENPEPTRPAATPEDRNPRTPRPPVGKGTTPPPPAPRRPRGEN
jgi:hypothetical protein